jgi:uncharacterized membrane protein (Fun14 family)
MRKIIYFCTYLLLSVMLFKINGCECQVVEYNIGVSSDALNGFKKVISLKKDQIIKLHENAINHMKITAKNIIAQKLAAQSWNPEIYNGLRRG